MKHEQIRERGVYEISLGKSPSGAVKKTRVTVVRFNPKTNSWTCRTDGGKDIVVKAPGRFLAEIKPKEKTVTQTPRKGPAPEKPKAPGTVTPEETERLLENVRKTARTEKIAMEAIAAGFSLVEEEMVRARHEAAEAKIAAEVAGMTLLSRGRSNGMMGGKEAALRVLREEGRPMRARELCRIAHEKGYCDMPGRTPWATIAAAIVTDINVKGANSRFKKTGPGLFAANDNHGEERS